MSVEKFAAIDIGSNSIRLLIEHVLVSETDVLFKKNALIRMPVRLGEEAFLHHEIPEKTIQRLSDTMLAYKYVMRCNEVLHYKAYATSAMREAKNGADICARIFKETGIQIEIISGQNEAKAIFASQASFATKLKSNCVFIDVGGGSTEITIFIKGNIHQEKSFDIGTIRILNNLVTKETWKEMKDWLKKNVKGLDSFSLVGSGGNINRIAKMTQLKQGKALNYEVLEGLINQLKPYSLQERMRLFDLNPDRADVIIPAGEIFMQLMKWLDAPKIFVPKIGLSDGMVREVYEEYKARK